jgi:hypothetical protein
MKLSELRSAIRSTKGNIWCIVPGIGIKLFIQKTPLLDELGTRFPGKDAETGYTFDPESMELKFPSAERSLPSQAEQLQVDDGLTQAEKLMRMYPKPAQVLDIDGGETQAPFRPSLVLDL